MVQECIQVSVYGMNQITTIIIIHRYQHILIDKNDDYAELSQIARYFIGGILDHASSLPHLLLQLSILIID